MSSAHARQRRVDSAGHAPSSGRAARARDHAGDEGILDLQALAGNAAVSQLFASEPVQRQSVAERQPRGATGQSQSTAVAEEDEAGPTASDIAPDEFDRQFLRAVEVSFRVFKLRQAGQPPRSPDELRLLATVPDWRHYIEKSPEIVPDKLVKDWLPARARRMTEQMLSDSERVARNETRRYGGEPGENDADELRQAATEIANAEDRYWKLTEESMSRPAEETGWFISEAYQDVEDLKKGWGGRFPILLAPGIDFKRMSKAGDFSLRWMIWGAAGKVLQNIDDSREHLREKRLDPWDLGLVTAKVKEQYGIEKGSVADQIIDNERKDRARSNLISSIATAVLQIGLGVVAIFATGGLALFALGAGAVLSGAQAIQHIVDYDVKKAARGTNLDIAQAISSEDPSLIWLALDIVGAVLDIAAATKAFRAISGAAGDLAKLEQVAQAEAAALKARGELEGSVEAFVARVMKSARANMGAAGMRARVLTELLQASGARALDLMVGDSKAMAKLLRQWGNWKELMLVLDAGTPEMKLVAQNLVKYRSDIVARLGKAAPTEGGFSAKVLSEASTEAISDVDLQVRTGRELIAAEEYMKNTFGANWESALRMNFYTEAGRLTKYSDVMKGLGRSARAALQRRITALAERLNLAKMLRHAGDDPDSIARVEGVMSSVVKSPEEAAEIRQLAKFSEAEGLARRNELLKQVDDLMAGFDTLPARQRAGVAEEITKRQMEANFLTKEAYIGPGGMRGATSGPESYQSALSQLEMIEHAIRESGGDVVRASREYELFKYINRFAAVAYRSGAQSKMMAYFESLSEYIYRVFREGHAEIPSGLPADWTTRSRFEYKGVGLGAGHWVRPSDVGAFPIPRAKDAFLQSQFNDFLQEATKALPTIKKKAMARPADWKPSG